MHALNLHTSVFVIMEKTIIMKVRIDFFFFRRLVFTQGKLNIMLNRTFAIRNGSWAFIYLKNLYPLLSLCKGNQSSLQSLKHSSNKTLKIIKMIKTRQIPMDHINQFKITCD